MDNLALQIQAAKKAGYTDQEIVTHLANDKTLGPQIAAAAKAGYSPTEIVSHVGAPAALGDTALKYSAASGLANLLDMVPRGVVNAGNLVRAAAGTVGKASGLLRADQMPALIESDTLDFANPLARRMGLINDKYAPSSPGGKIIDFTTQAVTGGGINPSAIARNAAAGLLKPVVRDLIAAPISGAGAALGNMASQGVNTGNASLDNAAKIGATIAGGMIPGGMIAARGTAGDRAAAVTHGMTPDQWSAADKQARLAAMLKNPVTGFEAIQSVTGMNPKAQTIQRLAEQSDAGTKKLVPMMQGRPAANAAMFGDAFNKISPVGTLPDTLAGTLQKTAVDALQKAKDFRSAAASPDYKAQRASDAEAMGLQDQIGATQGDIAAGTAWKNDAIQQAGKWLANSQQMGNKANQIGAMNLGWAGNKGAQRYLGKSEEYKGAAQDAVDAAKARQDYIDQWTSDLNAKQDALAEKNLPYIKDRVGGFLGNLDKEIKIAGPTVEGGILKSFRDEIAPDGSPIIYPSQLESIYKNNRNKLDLGLSPTDIQKTQAGVLGPHVKSLDNLIQEVSPAIKQGRQVYAQVSRDVVDPMDVSQVGKLARSDDFKQQSSTFLPDAPADVTPSVISRTAQALRDQNPDILKQFLAQDLRRKYSESSQQNVGGDNVMGGAKYAASVAGNPMQEDNLMAAIQSSGADPQTFQDALSVARAQGYKPAVNSSTFANADEANRLGGMASMLTSPIKSIQAGVDSWRNGMAKNDMARALSSGPESVKDIQNLARANGAYSPSMQQLLINFLQSGQVRNQANGGQSQ
jgi:hypothetical protein